MTETIQPMVVELDEDERAVFAQQLVDQAKAEGVDLIGPDGLLTRLTKTVLETALEGEISAHLGYEKGDPAGRNGENSRNGSRSKTVLTESGRSRSTCPGTATARSSRRSCASGRDAWTGSTSSSSHSPPGA
jgi:hypothetical protein